MPSGTMRGRFVRSSPGVLMGQSYETRSAQWWFHRVLLAVLACSVFMVFLVLRCQVVRGDAAFVNAGSEPLVVAGGEYGTGVVKS